MPNKPMEVWVTIRADEDDMDARMKKYRGGDTWALRIGRPATSIFLSPDQVLELADVLNGAVQQIREKKESSDAE